MSEALRQIVLATDLSEQAPSLFSHCLALALRARASLSLVHITGSGSDGDWARLPTVRTLLAAWGQAPPDAQPEVPEALGIRVQALDFAPTDGDVRLALMRRVYDLQPDLLVLGTHSRQGFDRLLSPSVSEPVVRDVRRMTLFVPNEAAGFVDGRTGDLALKRVMVPITSEVPQQPMIDALVRLFEAVGVGACAFVFVHVGGDGTLPVPALPSRPDWGWKTDRRSGGVVDQILEAEVEHEPDLIVMATEGPHGILDTLLGSTTERVLRRTRRPLLAIPV